MYGEEDRLFVPSVMRVAHRFDQCIPMVAGAGGKQQLTYAGMCLAKHFTYICWKHLRTLILISAYTQ